APAPVDELVAPLGKTTDLDGNEELTEFLHAGDEVLSGLADRLVGVDLVDGDFLEGEVAFHDASFLRNGARSAAVGMPSRARTGRLSTWKVTGPGNGRQNRDAWNYNQMDDELSGVRACRG